MKNKNAIPFYDYIDELNNNQSNWNFDNSTYPNNSYRKIKFDDYKKLIYKNTYMRLYNILINMYKWDTPKYISARTIELGYALAGQVCFFKSKVGTYCLPCYPHNRYNIYGDPVQVKTQGFNGFQLTINVKYGDDIPIRLDGDNIDTFSILDETEDYGVYSRDNDLCYPYINYVKEFAIDLTDKIIAHHIATQRIKVPYLWVVNDKDLKTTITDLMEKITDNDIYVVQTKNNSMKELDKSIKLENIQLAPNVVKEIENAIVFRMGQYCEHIGIKSNPQPDKSQVVLTSEINANDGLIMLQDNIRFSQRQKFCKDIKDIMGIDIKVEKNININEMIQNTTEEFINANGERKNNKETE